MWPLESGTGNERKRFVKIMLLQKQELAWTIMCTANIQKPKSLSRTPNYTKLQEKECYDYVSCIHFHSGLLLPMTTTFTEKSMSIRCESESKFLVKVNDILSTNYLSERTFQVKNRKKRSWSVRSFTGSVNLKQTKAKNKPNLNCFLDSMQTKKKQIKFAIGVPALLF